MKNKIIFVFILFILSTTSVYAMGLEIDEIKGYVNDERVSGIDESGGDFKVKPGDIIDLTVILYNAENTTTKARLKGTIDYIDKGNDIIKEQDWYDINAKDDKSKALSFSIPTDARRDDYDMDLKVYYKLNNGSEYDLSTISFDVMVSKEAAGETIVDVREIVSNLTAACNSIAQTTNTCFNYIDKSNNCSGELSTVKEERGTYKTKSDDCTITLDSCKTNKIGLENEKTSLNNQISNMVTVQKCNEQADAAVLSTKIEIEAKNQQTLMMGAFGVLVFWYFNKRKKEKSSVAGSYQSDYFKHG